MHCMVFRESVEPAFCVTFEADITNFKRKVKAQELSFTLAFVYAVCKCAASGKHAGICGGSREDCQGTEGVFYRSP